MAEQTSYGRQFIDEDDIEAVVSALRAPLLTGGPSIEKFEDELKVATAAPHAIACSNGTAALHLAMLGLGIGPGDVVIVPAISFVASANCARFVGADVIFADVDPETGLMTPETLETAIEDASTLFPNATLKAAITVHLNGQTENVAALVAKCQSASIVLVADACHALGTSYGPEEKWVGCAADAICETFSFHPVKAIATGEGGAVTCRDDELANRIALLRSHGITRRRENFRNPSDQTSGRWYYEMQELGFNYRMCDIQAALGTSQLAKLHRFSKYRAELFRTYTETLKDLDPWLRPIEHLPFSKPNWHLMSVKVDFDRVSVSREDVMSALADENYGSQVHYIPIFEQPYYRDYLSGVNQNAADRCPGALEYYAKQLSLPLHMGVTAEDVHQITAVLQKILKARR
ncbi:aminotransferase class I/II-fold pyridoxal phosphate-dependent enzyme [Ruegeria conchae]|uniref:aminotransferase class I/II-fold pyridoxal phosphate-dependent enzyme n=1 Tax=Ruegeria conchae TaxID=981384 RepID=UPI0014802A55|nr:aminotransferase class I/II-fold pyridoxal phosphate-dependent enzyme [Ruegeria conchae]UWR01965.1 aminotransferase class I/II-fold pyridoxal phosphate-dependent enzyme [Ruegeria conchae]